MAHIKKYKYQCIGELLGQVVYDSNNQPVYHCEAKLYKYKNKKRNKVLIGTIDFYESLFSFDRDRLYIYPSIEMKLKYNDKDNSFSIQYPSKMGLISNLKIYLYKTDNYNRIVSHEKYNVNIRSIIDEQLEHISITMGDLIASFDDIPGTIIKVDTRTSNFELPFEVSENTKISLEFDLVGSTK